MVSMMNLHTLAVSFSNGKGGQQDWKHERTREINYSTWKCNRKIVSLGCEIEKVEP